MSLVKSPKDIVEEAEASGSAGLLSRHPSWGRVEIGMIATIQNGAPFASESFNTNRSGFPIIRIRDVGKNEISTWFDGDYSDDFIVRRGDLLIGMDGDFRSSRWLGEPALLNQRVCRLIVSEARIMQAFIEFALPAYLDAIAAETSSITVKHLSSKSIQQIPLPLPPLAEQERIVEILEEQFSRLDSALASVKAVREKAKAFRRSLLHAAFSGELTGGTEGWKEMTLGEISEKPQYGWTTSASEIGKVKLLRTTDITRGAIDWLSVPFCLEVPKNLDLLRVESGDLFISRTGAGVGSSALITGLVPDSVFASYLIRVRPKVGYNNRFIFSFFQSPSYWSQIAQISTGTAQPNVNATMLRTISLPFPSPEIQSKIVEILEEQFSKLDEALEIANQLEARIDSERRSLLHAAFTGELTSQWRKTHV